MMRSQICDLISAALADAIRAGDAPDVGATVSVEPPKNPDHGDLSTNLAMVIAHPFALGLLCPGFALWTYPKEGVPPEDLDKGRTDLVLAPLLEITYIAPLC